MVSPHDYDRDERRSSSWWSSRHRSAGKDPDIVKRTRRLTLIDLAILVLMMGVLVPLLLTQADKVLLGPFQASIKEKIRGDERHLVLRVHLPGNGSVLSESPVGWRIFDNGGTLIHEEWDLPPSLGTTREFHFVSDAHEKLRCEIAAGDELYAWLF
jgi:hypothetical protein